MMRHVDICSGIGGFALGFQWAELSSPVLFCDIEPWSRKILAKHWPDVPIAEDVKELANDPDGLVPDCDIITAGYPCQPFSLAGERRGSEDDRHIWPYILSIVEAKRPAWCVFENVYGHVSMGLDEVLSDLEGQGYAARPFIVPACAADAPHRRDRVWIIARNMGDTDSQQRGATKENKGLDMDRAVLDQRQGREKADTSERSGGNVAHAKSLHSDGSGEHSQQGQRQEPKLGNSSSSDDVAHADSAQQSGKSISGRVQAQHNHADSSSSTVGSGAQDVANADSAGSQGLRREHEPLSERETEHAVGRGGKAVRDRTADVSDTSSKRQQRSGPHRNACNPKAHGEGQAAQSFNGGVGGFWLPEPPVGRVANGIPRRVDRLRGLGNAIVPQIAMRIGQTIKAVHDIPAQGHAHNNVNNQTT